MTSQQIVDQAEHDEIRRIKMQHTHTTQTVNGRTLYVCLCGARQQKSRIVNGVKVAVWKIESRAEETTRRHAIEMLETEGYGYGSDTNDPLDSHDPRNSD